jgi:hypothetical protein
MFFYRIVKKIMVSPNKYGSKYVIIGFLTALLGLASCSTGQDFAQKNPSLQEKSSAQENAPSQSSPIGVYVERLTQEGTDTVDKCKYCGRFFKIGDIHRDAETVIDVQVKMGLDERNILYENGRDQERYLHVYIYKFEERRGGNFSVEKPAGAGFHMHLFDRGTIKRIFVFDEDQRPLLENIFNIGKFLRRGMKWITVDKLSEEGVEKGLDSLAEDLRDVRRGEPEEIRKESLLKSE